MQRVCKGHAAGSCGDISDKSSARGALFPGADLTHGYFSYFVDAFYKTDCVIVTS
jgi:hypothetical protein